MRVQVSTLLPGFSALAAATQVATYTGYNVVWSDTFSGSAGDAPNTGLWTMAQSIHSNNELQVYTTSSNNVQISGGDTIQFVPRKSTTGTWTSGRIETIDAFTPPVGGSMMMEAQIRFGTNSVANKQGIWPAFWMLGDSVRHGTGWPMCGELDIMEMLNGVLTGYGTAHCGDTASGGICNESTGRQGRVGVPDDGWHTWNIKIDRSSENWTTQVITWNLDGTSYFTLKGSDIGDEGVWGTLAHSPFYMILNLAVGGNWPGDPNDATTEGYGSMMEVAYVAVYESA